MSEIDGAPKNAPVVSETDGAPKDAHVMDDVAGSETAAMNESFGVGRQRENAPGKGGSPALRSAEFRKGREDGWRRLDDMVGRVEKAGIAALSSAEVQLLPLLYRSVMSSLSVARHIALDRNLLLYLENLALRAYLVVYGPRIGVGSALAGFFRSGFPAAVRGMGKHLAVVFLVMLAAAIAGYALVRSDITLFSVLMPEGLAQGRGPGSTAEDLLRDELFAPWSGFVDTFIVFANSLFRHNTMIGILSFCLGFALGIPTVALVAYNGLVLGAFVALHAERGLTLDCIGWLSVHGVTEILALLLCGAAGLVIAEKILFPGALPRLESLAIYGRRAASVAAGAVALFFIAGLLEGGFRQLVAYTPGRYAMGLASAVLWFLYFTRCGKESHAA